MSELIFDEERHAYFLDGVKLPSVTQIIKPLYDFSAVPPDVLQRAAAFGTAVHKAVELYLKDDLDESELDDALVKPLQAFKTWQSENRQFAEMPCTIETPRANSRLKYAGTPDLDFMGTAVIDIKTRPVNMLTDPIQLAAYDHFDHGNRERYVLELRQDGRYVFTLLNRTKAASTEAWQRFRYLLDYHKMTSQIQLWRHFK